MARIPRSAIELHRPARGVRVTKFDTTTGSRYIALCVCGWETGSPLRVICDDEARAHRNQHRREATP